MASTPATEIAILPLPSGSTFDDPNTSAGRIWQDTLNTLHAQEGVQRSYWGREVENPSTLYLFVDWDSIDHHKRFIANTSAYGPFAKHLVSILDGDPDLFHAHFTPHPPTAALSHTSAPVTEILTAYFPPDLAPADADTIEGNIKQLLSVIETHAGPSFKGSAGGWVVEEVPYDAAKVEGGKARALVGVLGWESVEAHHAFRETSYFKENIELLRGPPQLRGTSLVHAKLTESQR